MIFTNETNYAAYIKHEQESSSFCCI